MSFLSRLSMIVGMMGLSASSIAFFLWFFWLGQYPSVPLDAIAYSIGIGVIIGGLNTAAFIVCRWPEVLTASSVPSRDEGDFQ